MQPKKDDIFLKKHSKSSFCFNKQVAFSFDDMAQRSIPFYKEIIDMTCKLGIKFCNQESIIYDLGCATASSIIALKQVLPQATFYGIDTSEDMISFAKAKVNALQDSCNIHLLQDDCLNFTLKKSDLILLNFTLQFIPVEQRENLLKKIFTSLNKGKIFILCEKIVDDNETINAIYEEQYYSLKENNGYSNLEIANKRKALENILIPNSIQHHKQLLQKVGFVNVSCFFQWYNFACFMAIK